MNIKNVENTVRGILIEHPEARDSDDILYYLVMEQRALGNKLPSLKTAFYNRKQLDIPSYDSVGRSRRKLQEKFEDLRGSAYATRYRREKEDEYIAYARDEEEGD